MRCVFVLYLLSAGLWLEPAWAAHYNPVLKKNNDAALRSPHVERALPLRGQRFMPSDDDRSPGEERKRRRRSN